MTETVTVRKDDLRLLMEAAAPPSLPSEPAVVPLNDALARCAEVLAGEVKLGTEGSGGTFSARDALLALAAEFEAQAAEYAGKWVMDTAETLQAAAALARERAGTTPAGEVPSPALPPGRYARVEIPGFRQNTGWVTEETRFGVQCAVVRDWNGAVDAEVVIGPGSRVVYLPTPLRRPEAQVALPAGDEGSEDEGCTCDGLEDYQGCPRHGVAF